MSVLPLVLALAASAAPPRFVATDPQQAQDAGRAWQAAERCTGWEAPVHDTVRITREFVRGGYSGGAYLDEEGLYRIELGETAGARTLVHELAHAWARSGPAALTEGRADLLADCIVSLDPTLGALDPDPGSELDHMPDLRAWSNPHGDHRAGDLDASRRDAYLGASRFLRVVASVLEPAALFPREGHLAWEDLARLLEEEGPRGATILAVLEAGVERQRAALSDADRDGVPWLAEILAGTDPSRWDSDGDGWWDGLEAPPSVAAIPLPPDGTPVCAGFAAGRNGATVQVLAQSRARGHRLPAVKVRFGDRVLRQDPADGLPVPPHTSVLLQLEGQLERTTGGTYAMVGGQGLVTDDHCRSTPRYTILVEDRRAAAILGPFGDELAEHLDRADSLVGPSDRRLVVLLGASGTGMEDGVVRLATGQIEWALATGRHDALAAVAVAIDRFWQQDDRDLRRWDAAEGLARALMDAPPDVLFVAVDDRAAASWAGESEACRDGWEGVVDGRCVPAASGAEPARPSADRSRAEQREPVPALR